MPDLIVKGSVTDRGKNPGYVLQLNVRVTMWREGTQVSHFFEGDVTTGSDGAFSYTVPIKAKVEDDFTITGGLAGGLIAVDIAAYVEGADTLHYQSPVVANLNHGQTFMSMANDLVGALRYNVDLSGLKYMSFFGVLEVDDQATSGAFAGVDGMMVEVMHNSGNIQAAGSWRVLQSIPTIRAGNTFMARAFFDPKTFKGGQQCLRFRSDGPDFTNHIVVRTPVLPADWLENSPGHYQSVAIARVQQSTGIGTVSATLPDRIFQFPFILKDPDLDFVDGQIRVRGRVGIGTGANLLLLTIAQFEARFTLNPVNYDGLPFRPSEFDNFFTVDVGDASVDLLPGTDLDELPWWVYAAVAVLAPTLAGAVLIIKAIEAIFKPLVRDLVRSEGLKGITRQLKNKVTEEIDDRIQEANQLATAKGRPLTPDEVVQMKENVWFESEAVTLTADNLKVTGWGGVLHPLTLYMRDIYANADCPFNAADRRSTAAAASAPSALKPGTVFRHFHNVLDVDGLGPWMERYERHRTELLTIVQTKPDVVSKLVKVSLANHAATREKNWRMSAESARGFAELCNQVKAAGSPELGRFMDDLEQVISAGIGKSVDELKLAAAARQPSPSIGRSVPPHRMGRGPITGPLS